MKEALPAIERHTETAKEYGLDAKAALRDEFSKSVKTLLKIESKEDSETVKQDNIFEDGSLLDIQTEITL